MFNVYVRHKDLPKKCITCPFCEGEGCLLLPDEQNRKVETLKELFELCPILTAETDFFVPFTEIELAEAIFSKREIARMYVVRCRYTEELERENAELKKMVERVMNGGKSEKNR